MKTQVNIMVGGEAGQGVQSVGFILARTLARGGYHVFADQDYESRVRGGHNFYRVRAADTPVGAISEPVDILVALNRETVDLHKKETVPEGVIIYDSGKEKMNSRDSRLFGVPLEELAVGKAGNKVMSNTVALGATFGLIGFEFKLLEKALKDQFGTGDMGKNNVKAARAGYEFSRKNYKGAFSRPMETLTGGQRMLINGNEAIALGALAAGCRFLSAYPMTPATSIMEYIISKSDELGIAVVQAEDEIAAVNMAVGAGYAGARAMTVTSGSGFCLMAEGLGMAGITETPVVIVNAQRPGPAVGLPTRTEQGDLQFVLTAHHGEFPRVIMAPGDAAEAFRLTAKAFNLVEQYQLPAIILTDQYLASSYMTVDPFDLSEVSIDRGLLFTGKGRQALDYRRHAVTRSGISPRAFPGMSDALVVTDSDEHDEQGHLIEDALTRARMVEKRMNKQKGLQKEAAAPVIRGRRNADTLLIGWGSTAGALREAADILNEDGGSVAWCNLGELLPFPAIKMAAAMEKAKECYVVESNATGQLARLILTETGRSVTGTILRYDGRPITPRFIVEMVHEEADNGRNI